MREGWRQPPSRSGGGRESASERGSPATKQAVPAMGSKVGQRLGLRSSARSTRGRLERSFRRSRARRCGEGGCMPAASSRHPTAGGSSTPASMDGSACPPQPIGETGMCSSAVSPARRGSASSMYSGIASPWLAAWAGSDTADRIWTASSVRGVGGEAGTTRQLVMWTTCESRHGVSVALRRRVLRARGDAKMHQLYKGEQLRRTCECAYFGHVAERDWMIKWLAVSFHSIWH